MTEDELAAVVAGIAPVLRGYVKSAVADVVAQLGTLDGRVTTMAGAAADVGALRERVAVLETRAPVPGPPGPPGHDGADGVGFDDLAVEQTGDGALTVSAIRGDVVKAIGTVAFPVVTFTGDFEPGRTYTAGNIVRAKSALWHCKAATTIAPDAAPCDGAGRPTGPQGRDFWQLLLRDGKRGAEGRPGTDGKPGAPGRDWQQVYDDTRRR